MITILIEKYLGADMGVAVTIAEIAIDNKEYLPAPDGISDRILSPGSLAWEISAGELWGLDGEGKWINQTTSEVYDPAPDEETETEAIEEAE